MGREKTAGKKVAIISRESDAKTIDIALLERELLDRGLEVETRCKLLSKDKSLKSLSYVGEIAAQTRAIAGADVVVLDTYCIPASMLPHSKETKIIQMWHALGAVKKFGWQTVGMADGTSVRTARLMRMHRGYDYVLASSDATAQYFCEAFDVAPGKIVKLGLPRIDYIRSVTNGAESETARKRIYEKYPKLNEEGKDGTRKRIILYAPTFRRGESPDLQGLADALDPDRYNLIVKLHPLYRGSSEKLRRENVIYDEVFNSFELLAAADAVISDYSSLVIESMLADNPLYLYTYDIDRYSRTTGLNMDFAEEAIGKYAFKSATELAASLEEPYDMEALREFRDKYIEVDYEEQSCTAQLADFIESLT